MKGFLVDERGDIVIVNGSIALVENIDLKAQTLRTVMGTNKGEWFLNDEEGIDFSYMLGKGITEDMQLAQCKDACNQVDESLTVVDFRRTLDKTTRKAEIYFKAQGDNVDINVRQTYGDMTETNADASSKLALANARMVADRNSALKLERRLSGQ
jgi:hypothetical protein